MENRPYALSASGKKALDAILKKVIAEVKPSKSEIADAKYVINTIMGRLKKNAPSNVEILLAGSIARGTQIRGKSDIDIFLLFPRTTKESVVEAKGLEIGKSIVDKKNGESYLIKYAEHPYVRLMLNNIGVNFDIVPAYKIYSAKERGTAVDRTQLHNEFVNSTLTDKQRDDVRILKAFLKAHNIYGAEARIEGFSGYLCELLIYNYGSFANLLTKIANSKLPILVNTANSRTTGEDTASMLKFFNHRFIIIDPTDGNRNVAANVSEESYFRFVLASRQLLTSPTKIAFYGIKKSDAYPQRQLSELRTKLETNIYLLHFRVPDIANEIIWQQLKKVRLRLGDVLKEHGFEPVISLQNVEGKDAIIGFFINNVQAGSTKVVGPKVEMAEAVERFIKSHRNSKLISIEQERIYAIEPAEYRNPEKLVRAFIGSKSTALPSNIKAKNSSFYLNKMPESCAKLLYAAYSEKFSIL